MKSHFTGGTKLGIAEVVVLAWMGAVAFAVASLVVLLLV